MGTWVTVHGTWYETLLGHRHPFPMMTDIEKVTVESVFAIAVTRRETNGWKWPAFMVGYLFDSA